MVMVGKSIELRVGSQRLVILRWHVSLDASMDEARALSPTEARWHLERITDLRELARIIELADEGRGLTRSLIDADRDELLGEIVDLLGRGLLRALAHAPRRAVVGSREDLGELLDEADDAEQAEAAAEPEERHWIEVRLVDTQGNPLRKLEYELALPTGERRSGHLDQNGFLRVDGLPPGQCKISFPAYDASAWDFAEGA